MWRLSPFFSPGPIHSDSKAFLITASVACTIAVSTAVRFALYPPPSKIVPSPRKTLLPNLSTAEQAELAYPPDAFPGARDVESPYGTIRVHEWGPEDGRKVLLIHGISTPCLSLGGVASALVDKGCRVMLLDLWGRGYSDSVDLPHDSRLYTTEILIAITSSPLAWTPEGFSLIGYSLGGGIAADFASYFPNLVKSLVLLAPAGLIRSNHIGWQSRLMYLLELPPGFVGWAVGRRLRAGANDSVKKDALKAPEAAIKEEIQGTPNESAQAVQLSKTRPLLTVAAAVKWQLDHHRGFVHSFVSSIQNSSIERTPERLIAWGRLGRRKDKVIIIAGAADPIIIPSELEADAKEVIGADKVEWRVIDGAHDFPVTHYQEVVEKISDLWFA